MSAFLNTLDLTSLGKSSKTAVSFRRPAVVKRQVMVGQNGRALKVDIQRPAANKRKISSSIIIQEPTSVVWKVLTDYNRLAEFIPNLAISRRRFHPNGGIRIEQCGVQSILGFEFKASVVLDMVEVNKNKMDREIRFEMHDSRDFKEFSGKWSLKNVNNGNDTQLSYEVCIVPKGLVPVNLVEWRIKEDVPVNLRSVKSKSETMTDEDMRAYKPALSPGKELRKGEAAC
ncbi:hypothetical protein NDN08_002473 [Rhodosorus marinus]|uniref:Coenzyme Q-binding protein COQ10 START domain-containing protein n=1 Tax=Rhodosorus marinus TaxID=101924 RepID=A0AAV8UXD0_9RHOD|nr:hypothetical protein NDN08_002473 [Rhodosorus marinus]